VVIPPTKPRGRPRDAALRERRREEILDAAAAAFARHGYPDTDVQFIADALHLSKGTIYRYFLNKEDLFLAAVDRGLRQLNQWIETAIQDISDPLEQITVGVRLYLDFFRDHPECVELLIQERAEFRDRKEPTYFENRAARRGRWSQVYRDLIAAGRVRDVPVDRILDVVGDLVYGTMFTNYFTRRHKSPQEQAQDIIDIVFHGILTDAERDRRAALNNGSGNP
jgi:AcrR family transcriptional regulator